MRTSTKSPTLGILLSPAVKMISPSVSGGFALASAEDFAARVAVGHKDFLHRAHARLILLPRDGGLAASSARSSRSALTSSGIWSGIFAAGRALFGE